MTDNKLVINKQEFPLNYKLLQIIARMLPQEAHYAPLAKAILTLNVPSITSELISNEILEPSDLDAIWGTGDLELRRALLDESAFLEHLTDAQADEIIGANDHYMLMSVAENADMLLNGDETARLSSKKGKELLKFLSDHADLSVRNAILENEQLEAKWKLPLKEMLENNYQLTVDQLATLTEKDIENLMKTTRDNLVLTAEYVEKIKNKQARQKIAELLAAHPDPKIRLTLAANWEAPQKTLEKLATDADEDVSAKAKSNIRGK